MRFLCFFLCSHTKKIIIEFTALSRQLVFPENFNSYIFILDIYKCPFSKSWPISFWGIDCIKLLMIFRYKMLSFIVTSKKTVIDCIIWDFSVRTPLVFTFYGADYDTYSCLSRSITITNS